MHFQTFCGDAGGGETEQNLCNWNFKCFFAFCQKVIDFLDFEGVGLEMHVMKCTPRRVKVERWVSALRIGDVCCSSFRSRNQMDAATPQPTAPSFAAQNIIIQFNYVKASGKFLIRKTRRTIRDSKTEYLFGICISSDSSIKVITQHCGCRLHLRHYYCCRHRRRCLLALFTFRSENVASPRIRKDDQNYGLRWI